MKTLAQVVAVAATCTSRPRNKLPATSFLSFALPFVACCTLFAVPAQATTPPELDSTKQKQLAALRLPFIANQGQFDADVKFYARTFGGTTFVTADGKLVHAFAESPPAKDKRELGKSLPPAASTRTRGWSLMEELVQARPVPQVAGEEPSASHVSFFVGNDRSKWQGDVPTYGSVSLGEVYPNIGYRLKAYGNNVEKLFEVHPGGNPGDIQIRLQGAQELKVTEDGALEITTELGPIRFTAPIAYQEQEGKRIPVEVAYALTDDGYKFKLGDYDKATQLVIDPLLQSTYLGGSGQNSVSSIAVDQYSNVYLVGSTTSLNFPGTAGGAQSASGGGNDVFVAKLNYSLGILVQISYLGGSNDDMGYGLALDGASNVWVVGSTASPHFPGTASGAQPAFGGGTDMYVAKLAPDLKSLIRSTYLGGAGNESATTVDYRGTLALTINGTLVNGDGTGYLYVAGHTSSGDFPGVSGGAQDTLNGASDGVVALFNGDLTTLLQSTFLGGSGSENINAMRQWGDVFVAGSTDSTDFPAMAGGAQAGYGGGQQDGFVSKISEDLRHVKQSTYLGGGQTDLALTIHPGPAADVFSPNDMYVAGASQSTDFPGTSGGAQAGKADVASAGFDGFVARLDNTLTTIRRATYFGGSGNDRVTALVWDNGNQVFATGATESPNLPNTGGYQPVLSGASDAFIARFNTDLTVLSESTYLGGSATESGTTIAMGGPGSLYVAGDTTSFNSFPKAIEGVQKSRNSVAGNDAFVARFYGGLSDNGTYVPNLVLSTSTLDYEYISTGTVKTLTKTIFNSGFGLLVIDSISIDGAGASYYSRRVSEPGDCPAVGADSRMGLWRSEQCNLVVTFSPGTSGLKNATLRIVTNDPSSPSNISLAGIGVEGPVAPAISLMPSVTTLDFGTRPLSWVSDSSPLSISLTNTGNGLLHISSISINGTNADEFVRQTGDGKCNAGALAPGASCTLAIIFTTHFLGPRTATMTIASNAAGSPHQIALLGTGWSPIITTIAGTGSAGFSGDHGLAVAAQLDYPKGIASDTQGNWYVADINNSNIRRIDAITGIITTVAGSYAQGLGGDNGPATSAQMVFPLAVAVDLRGNLFIAEKLYGPTTGRIRKVDSNGIITTLVGTNFAVHNAIDNSDTWSSWYTPTGLVADAVGNVYVADTGNNCVRKISPEGTVTNIAGIPGSLTGGFSGDGGPATSARLSRPHGLAIDIYGNLFIADRNNSRIRKVAPNGVISTVAGTFYGFSGDGGPATAAQLSAPVGVAIDAAGNLFISDQINERIRRVAHDGTITTVVGIGTNGYSGDNGPATTAQLNYPDGVAISGQGNLAIVDTQNQRIRLVQGIKGSNLRLDFNGSNAVTFANRQLSETSTAAAVTLTNTDSTAHALTAIQIVGTNAIDFIQSNNCGGSLAAGNTCVINVQFSPSALGLRNATLIVQSDDPVGPSIGITLSGRGGIGAVSVPSILTLPNANVGSPTAAQSLSLANTGNGPLSISAINIGGSNAVDFARQTGGANCSTGSLAAGASCSLSVVFTPSAASSRTATLSITSDAPGSPHVVSLSGTGGYPSASFSPSATLSTFGAQKVGTSSTPHTVTLTNSGNASLNISAIGISGTSASDYVHTSNCGGGLSPSAACTINVIFTPTATGPRIANLSVTSDASGSPHVLSLNGTGTLIDIIPILMLLLE